MSFELTPERLQEIAVSCVTQYIQKQASLSGAIAKEAMDLELNPEQTKRVIEATNTIAYLRQLEKSADRTFEFEVADYGHVMADMCLPESMRKVAGDEADKEVNEDLSKAEAALAEAKKDQARDDREDKGDDKDDKKKSKGDDKKKSKGDEDEDSNDDEDDSEEEKQEKRAMLRKGYFQAMATLEKMAYDEAAICMELVRVAGLVGKDPHGLEKLASVVDKEDLDKTLKLCGIEKRAEENLIVTQRELADANELYSLYKQANEFVKHRSELHDFAARAEELLFHKTANVEKLAGLGGFFSRGIGAATHGIGYMTGKAVSGVGKMGVEAVGNLGSFGRASTEAGFKSTGEGVAAYDKIRKTQGLGAAAEKFGGSKPSFLVHRLGVGGLASITAGVSMEHKNNVNDI